MAEVTRMTADEVVSYFLEGEGVDVLRDSLLWVCQQLMEAEVSESRGCRPARFLSRCRIAPSKTVGGMTERQRGELIELFRR